LASAREQLVVAEVVAEVGQVLPGRRVVGVGGHRGGEVALGLVAAVHPLGPLGEHAVELADRGQRHPLLLERDADQGAQLEAGRRIGGRQAEQRLVDGRGQRVAIEQPARAQRGP
jgi:hypothetical protein